MIWFRKRAKGLSSPRPELRAPLFADEKLAVVCADLDDDPDTPWARFHAAYAWRSVGEMAAARARLHEALALPTASTRLLLQAWTCLRELGEQPDGANATKVRGVVVDFGLDQLETIAGYEDRTAFAILRSGAAVDWVTPHQAIDTAIAQLLEAGAAVVEHTAPHHGERENAPETGHVLISVLTFAGTHVGTGPAEALENDPVGGPVLRAARALQRQLASKGSSAASR